MPLTVTSLNVASKVVLPFYSSTKRCFDTRFNGTIGYPHRPLPTAMSDDRSARLVPTNPGRAPLTFQIPCNALADCSHQRIELFGRGGVDPMKSQLNIALGRKDASTFVVLEAGTGCIYCIYEC